jgi:uncharacterized protein (DUF927 family)
MQHESRFTKIGDTEERNIINRLGFMDKTQPGVSAFYVIPKLFREEMCKGMNVKMVRKILKKACMLEVDADGKNPKCPAYVDGNRPRLATIVVKSSLPDECGE